MEYPIEYRYLKLISFIRDIKEIFTKSQYQFVL